MSKVCIICHKTKNLNDFYKADYKSNRLRTECKSCLKRITADRASKRDKRLKRNTELKYKYGITMVDYDNMSNDQQSTCKICKKFTNKLAVDHCHKTGKVRGLLCTSCNQGLGLMKDNIDSLNEAIKYLQESLLK